MEGFEEEFSGNEKHYKILRKALSEKNISLWNDFAASLGAGFRADLTGMDLSGRDLTGAKLTGARLDGVCLDGANLTGADLSGASLTGASFRDARLEGTRTTPPRMKVRSKSIENPETLDLETRRRLKIHRIQDQAREFLEDKAKKEAVQAKQKAQVKARNNPSPFANEDR